MSKAHHVHPENQWTGFSNMYHSQEQQEPLLWLVLVTAAVYNKRMWHDDFHDHVAGGKQEHTLQQWHDEPLCIMQHL